MSKEEQGMPFVPEEDLNLHEDFKPIIAENGIIRPKPVPDEEALPPFNGTFTRMDTIQDLVELRTAEDEVKAQKAVTEEPKDKTLSPQTQTVPKSVPVPQEASVEKLPEVLPNTPKQSPSTKPAEGEGEKRTLPTVSRKTIFRLKKKRLKKKKAAALKKTENTPSQKKETIPPKNSSKQAPQPVSPAPKKSRRWPWVLVVLCFLFLGGISGLVPVEKIPLLRNLAYAMGFDKTDTARMSFLRALLTWSDKHFALPGLLQQDAESRAELWARLRGNAEQELTGDELAGLQERLTSAGGKTSLIDVQALQTLQRQKGRALDEVRGSVMPIPGQEGEPAAPLRDGNVNVRTEANQDKSDVFFGSDTSAVNRQTKDGYDSVNTLKKLANPYVTDGHPIDWLTNTAKRMIKADTGLGGINRGLSGTQVNWATDLNDVGEQKPHRDLYHAWITSRMSKYTSNLMLKKSLADTSFMGADMPSIASNVFSFGGVQVDVDSLREDQEAWKEYQEFERKCKEALKTAGSRIQNRIDSFNASMRKVDASSWDFPSNCAVAYPNGGSYETSNFSKRIQEIRADCQSISQNYQTLENDCHMRVDWGTNCDDRIVEENRNHWTTFANQCAGLFEEKFNEWLQNEWWTQNRNKYLDLISAKGEAAAKQQVINSQRENLRSTYQNGKWKTDGAQRTEQQYITENIPFDSSRNNFPGAEQVTMRHVVIDQYGGGSGYFPEEGNIAETVTDYMQENKTLKNTP